LASLARAINEDTATSRLARRLKTLNARIIFAMTVTASTDVEVLATTSSAMPRARIAAKSKKSKIVFKLNAFS
jgi:hypothetical protein